MLRSDFINLPEWQAIVGKLHEWMAISKEQPFGLVDSGDVNKVAMSTAFQGGIIAACEAMLQLPEKLFSDGEPKKEEPEDVLNLKKFSRESRIF